MVVVSLRKSESYGSHLGFKINNRLDLVKRLEGIESLFALQL